VNGVPDTETSAITDVTRALVADRVAAVLRAPTIADAVGLAATLADAGVRCVEFTFSSDNVLDALRAASGAGYCAGVGTVVEREQAEAAIEAGARFVVSPAVRPQIVDVCHAAGVPVILGAMTPTEVLAVADAGADAVKVFPASVGGTGFVKALRSVFPQLLLMPSGGVTISNAVSFLDAGASAVFAGSDLASGAEIAAGRHDDIGERARRLVASLPREPAA
jgi:2-dehydro-3-deoxyphosphogluconate aldolase/(4S)-4-hydroxy-2-oxoglutarate aldolase